MTFLQRVTRGGWVNLFSFTSKSLTPGYASTRWLHTQEGAETFLSGESSPYLEQMFEAWKNDPNSVHTSWNAFFQNLQKGYEPSRAFQLPPEKLSPLRTPLNLSEPFYSLEEVLPNVGGQTVHDTSRIIQMIRSYQMRGHEVANVDPLGLPKKLPFVSSRRMNILPNFDYKYYGFTERDLDKVFDCRIPGLSGFFSADREPQTLRKIVQRLEETYCGSIGVEYMHISDQAVCNFIRQMIETPTKYHFSPDLRMKILIRTARAQLFENFCASKFSTSKRFGLDGCETMIVGMKALTKKAAREGVESIVLGMSHRGRLNVLANVMHKPMQQMMSEFQGITGFGGTEWGNTGDVKYHLGVEFDHWDADSQRYIHMGILANPSHLEAVNPLVLGQAAAQQYYSKDTDNTKVLPIILHGDASFSGQGVVYETLQMSKLPGYSVGGTIHFVVNNQIGFTTCPLEGGSGMYCTDIAKCIDAPVFHVNCDDPEAVTFVCELAFAYRQTFHSDVIIDLVGYRRFGHNEMDMPKFTQPLMYNLIARHKPVLELYSEKLIAEDLITSEGVDKIKSGIIEFYSKEYEKSKTFTPSGFDEYLPQWQHMATPQRACVPRLTGVPIDHLRELGRTIFTLPEDFESHPTITKLFQARLQALESGQNIDFGLAELLAYASVLSDGFHVRLSGQDCQRGTFSHRHSVVHDQTFNTQHNIFDKLEVPQKIFIINSPLSEYAALGFETGYATEHPDTLCVWEAQFGDFANGAQIIIDQFIVSGEVKWNRQCGIVLMLPHGYDGQGPEHSSARIERFLQLCDDREDVIHPFSLDSYRTSVIQQHNIQVINVTTPFNMFHALRRQIHRGFRKPLIIFSPKRLLKMRAAHCNLADMDESTRFKRYIHDDMFHNKPEILDSVERLILCSGQIYYDLNAYKEKHGLENILISRVEQLSPFPFDCFMEELKKLPNLKSLVWAQEEPMNAGPWSFISKRIETTVRELNRSHTLLGPIYAGRDAGAATAVGDTRMHAEELEKVIEGAFNLKQVTHLYSDIHLTRSKPTPILADQL